METIATRHELTTAGRMVFYENGTYEDEVDTYLTRDEMYVSVHDTDENRILLHGNRDDSLTVQLQLDDLPMKRTDHPDFWLIATPFLIGVMIIFYLLHRRSNKILDKNIG